MDPSLAVENENMVTVFVYNIPTSMHWKGLWALFGYHGNVVDAFIPTKRSRNGKRFGFVKFTNERDAQRSEEIAQEEKSEERLENDARTEVKIEKRIVQGHVEDELLWNLQKCLSWSEKLKLNERVAWIEVSGVPLHCWNYETFKRVAGLWGNLVSIGEILTKVHNFKKIELLISITQSKMVDELVSMKVGDELFPVRVREQGLTEMNDNSLNIKARRKKNEEDNISGSGSVARTRPEIPLEGREIVKSGVLMDINLENGNNINNCQRMLEMVNKEAVSESVSKEIKIGEADEVDKCKGQALKEVRDMGLAVVEDPIEYPKEGGNDNGSSMDVGYCKCGLGNIRVVSWNSRGLGAKVKLEVDQVDKYLYGIRIALRQLEFIVKTECDSERRLGAVEMGARERHDNAVLGRFMVWQSSSRRRISKALSIGKNQKKEVRGLSMMRRSLE
ncbi:delta-cadinene synthase isozyme XC1 [Gossypium australe]|uniref:Delta-cadinene synthase isozyme XC1 n=1 Tax=Gossypium australe TaxID=47621 RepID=A0A5B6VGC7_9ROSI|nr:delta-cadinene synthase isozyme XC1 [Gossypium australe]